MELVDEVSDADFELNTELAMNTVELSEIKDLYEKVLDGQDSLEPISHLQVS